MEKEEDSTRSESLAGVVVCVDTALQKALVQLLQMSCLLRVRDHRAELKARSMSELGLEARRRLSRPAAAADVGASTSVVD